MHRNTFSFRTVFIGKWALIATVVLMAVAPFSTLAHEVYVLPHDQVKEGLTDTTINPFLALQDPGNLRTTALISVGILAALIIGFFIQHSRSGERGARAVTRFNRIGLLLVRIAVAAALIASAANASFLGPEISLSLLPFSHLVQMLLYVVGSMLLFGFLTEIAATLALGLFLVASYYLHFYMLMYVSYVGEFIALIICGSRMFSVDQLVFGPRKLWARLQKYETVIIRVAYGFTLMYAAIVVKFMHAILTLDVVKDYNLTQFHLLFPHDPLLVVLGAGMSEVTIGLFIMLGFQVRLTVLVSLFYITLSLLFFGEKVWPHYILYGVSLFLLVAPSTFTLDSLIHKKLQRSH